MSKIKIKIKPRTVKVIEIEFNYDLNFRSKLDGGFNGRKKQNNVYTRIIAPGKLNPVIESVDRCFKSFYYAE